MSVGLHFNCFRCKHPIEVPGALLFSPPFRTPEEQKVVGSPHDDEGMCTKIHLCVVCYEHVLESCRAPTPIVLEKRFAALEQWLLVKAEDDTTAEQCAQWRAAASHLGHAANCMSILDAIEKGDPNG